MNLSTQVERLSPREALRLLEEADLLELGRMADGLCRRLHGGRVRTYAVDRNINFTNVCACRCRFCAFWRSPDDPEAFLLDEGQVAEKVREAVAQGATHILMQGGLHPGLSLGFYERLLRRIKERFDVLLHCFSPPEVHGLATRSGLSVRETLGRLQDAGLDSLPGGGAEILNPRVRRLISPRKCTADEWIAVMRAAHELGMGTTATMVFGHVETSAERVGHLERIRDLQDETGGFTAFIAWPFQPGRTQLARSGGLPAPKGVRPTRTGWQPVTGVEYLRMLAVARLFLDNVANVQASWVTMGPKIGQVALAFGANDLGSTMIEENVVAAAGCLYQPVSREMLRRLIRAAGFEPRQRDSRYQHVGP